MRVLVVGATGVVGRQLVPRLATAGHEVVAISRSAREEPWPTAEHRRLDLLDADAVRALVGAVRPDAIIHQATSLTGLGNNIRRLGTTRSPPPTGCVPRERPG